MAFFKKIFGKNQADQTTSSAKVHALKVAKIERLTQDAVRLDFDLPQDLKTFYQFHPGQYITLIKDFEGNEQRRSYSLCSLPNESLSVGVKKVEGGLFSTYLNDSLAAGDTLSVMLPEGKFIFKEELPKRFLAIAAGSGITPILSQIKHLLQQESKVEICLLYANKALKDVMFYDELQELAQNNKHFQINYYFSQESVDDKLPGRIDEEKLDELFTNQPEWKSADAIHLCGPKAMIDSLSRHMINCRIPKEKIHFELFTVATNEDKARTKSKTASGVAKVFLNCEGEAFEFDLDFNGDSILDAAIDAGADAPYSCRGGVCSTCQAKLLEGQVEMDMNYSLDKEDIAKGFILTCQAHPISEKVVIDYDQMM